MDVYFICKSYVNKLAHLGHCSAQITNVCCFVFSKTGTAYIRKILQHKTPKEFLSSVIAEVIQPFVVEEVNESSCLSSSLSIIEETGNFTYKLTLDSQSKC